MDDLISRQAAVDELIAMREHIDAGMSIVGHTAYDMAIEALRQPEIIRCTECKHYREYDSKYVKNAVVVQCMADRYPISETIPDGWFCAGAERKDDE